MPLRPRRSTAFLGLLLLAVAPMAAPADEVPTNASAAASYGYPIADPLLATVLGTPPALRAAVPDEIDLERRSLTLFPDREIPRVLWSSRRFEYSLAAQKEPAPLIFLIAGTGARFDSEKNAYLQKVLYQAGMSVVNISSPTHPDFIITASRSSVPGFMEADVEDLYRVMKRIFGSDALVGQLCGGRRHGAPLVDGAGRTASSSQQHSFSRTIRDLVLGGC